MSNKKKKESCAGTNRIVGSLMDLVRINLTFMINVPSVTLPKTCAVTSGWFSLKEAGRLCVKASPSLANRQQTARVR